MSIRPAQPESDYPGIAAVVNAFEPESVNIRIVRQWFEHMPPGRIAHRVVAANEDNEAVGYGVALHETWWPPGHFYASVGMDTHWRRRGLGLALWEDVQAFLQEQGAAHLTSEVRDDDPVSLRLAERNGFSIDRHLFLSTLDLNTFDEAPYKGLVAALEAAGIRFLSMDDARDGPEARRKLWELNELTGRDIPGVEGGGMPFEEFEQRVCGSSSYRPEGQLLAADGETWVGLCAVLLRPETGRALNTMTGVLRAYRGRKIALALKLLAIRYARRNGAHCLDTDNDSLNTPMLAINNKLGYKPQRGLYTLRRGEGPPRP
jgi:GNAT superfamily N-acetyltransferase